jgi:hypothetical protein
MHTKIVIGKVVIASILLVMPSIPALQNTMPNTIPYNEVCTVPESVLPLTNHTAYYAHPLLYAMVIILAKFRWERCLVLAQISFNVTEWPFDIDVYYPLLFLRCIWLLNTFGIWCIFWSQVSDTLGWNWAEIASIVIK